MWQDLTPTLEVQTKNGQRSGSAPDPRTGYELVTRLQHDGNWGGVTCLSTIENILNRFSKFKYLNPTGLAHAYWTVLLRQP
jgi:hypothetical protein